MFRRVTLSLVLLTTVSVYSQVDESDSLALVALYNSTNGSGWTDHTNWLTANGVDTWKGITVTGGRVTRIMLGDNNLTGTLTDSIGDLAELTFLGLLDNHITDTIPAEIGNLTKLRTVILSGNQFTGKIPATISNCTSLRGFFAKSNQLEGPLPPELGGCVSLVNLYLDSNQIDGNIPPELGQLGSLQNLSLRSNKLTGSIPPQLGNLSVVKELYLSDNQLSGTIPSTIGNLSTATLIFLGANQLTGEIPASLGGLSGLTKLYLGENQLTGTIPDALSNLTTMTWLSLANNRLEGSMPSGFTDLTSLATLIVSHNKLTGLLSSFTGMTALTTLNVEGNSLTFEDVEPHIPSTFTFDYAPQDSVDTARVFTLVEGADITLSLVTVGGTANQYQWMKDSSDISGANGTYLELTDIVPEDSGLYNCKITNTTATELTIYSRPQILNVIPQGFIADSLALIDLYNATDGDNWTDNTNWLTAGALETWFGVTVEAKRITELILPANNLNGTMPLTLGNITQLRYLDLSGNVLSGLITPQLGNCTELLHLDLSHNQFTDTVPATFTNLAKLAFCAVDSNRLTVFPELSATATLDTLALEHNAFTFEDIEPHIHITEFTYVPQDSVGSAGRRTLVEADLLLLYVSVGGIANEYQWIKDGVDIVNAVNDTLLIQSVVPGDSGIYSCRITNTTATALTLFSYPESVTVIPQGFIDDSLALIDFYNSTGGTQWSSNANWCTTAPLSTWYGVSVEGRRLVELDLMKNNLTGSVPSSFGACTALKRLLLTGNGLATVPAEMADLHSAVFITLNSNQLTALPDLSGIAVLETLCVQHNKLVFSDIVPNTAISEFTYSPQDSVGEKSDTTLYIGDTLRLSVSVGGTGNTYQWTLNGVSIPGATNPVYEEDSVLFSDSGSYVCAVANPGAPALIIYSHPVHVLVEMPVQNKNKTGKTGMSEAFVVAENPVSRSDGEVTFYYEVPKSSTLRLDIYDALGNRVHTDDFSSPSGRHKPPYRTWDLRNRRGKMVACGTYLAVFTVQNCGKTYVVKKRVGVKSN